MIVKTPVKRITIGRAQLSVAFLVTGFGPLWSSGCVTHLYSIVPGNFSYQLRNVHIKMPRLNKGAFHQIIAKPERKKCFDNRFSPLA